MCVHSLYIILYTSGGKVRSGEGEGQAGKTRELYRQTGRRIRGLDRRKEERDREDRQQKGRRTGGAKLVDKQAKQRDRHGGRNM